MQRVNPVRVELSRDYKFSTDQVAIKVAERVNGDLLDTAAIAYLVNTNLGRRAGAVWSPPLRPTCHEVDMDRFEANVNGLPLTVNVGKLTVALPAAPATVAAGVRDALTGIARQLATVIAPQLPEPRPAHREVQRDEQGRIVGMDEWPADPSRAVAAAELGRLIAAQYEAPVRAAVGRLVR